MSLNAESHPNLLTFLPDDVKCVCENIKEKMLRARQVLLELISSIFSGVASSSSTQLTNPTAALL